VAYEPYEAGPEPACELPVAAIAGEQTDAQLQVAMGPNHAALAGWAQHTGALTVAAYDAALAPCDGLPRVHPIDAPLHGAAIGLSRPAAQVPTARGVAAVVPLGPPDWWIVVPDPACPAPCPAEVAFPGDERAAPTLFSIHRAAAAGSAPVDVHIPPGGAAILQVGPDAAWWFPEESLEVAQVRDALLVSSPGAVDVVGFVRIASGPPRAVRLAAQGGWGRTPGGTPEVAVRAGRKRGLRVDVTPLQHWVADPDVLTVSRRGARLRLTGGTPGRTHLVLDDGAGLRLVRVTVTDPAGTR